MSLLLSALRDPTITGQLSATHWNLLLRTSRAHGLCARLSWMMEDQGQQDHCPPVAWNELSAQRFFAEYMQSQVRLERRKLHRALAPRGIPVMLLKGAAYAAAELKVARGRSFADIDIMLPRDRLEEAETALERAGWLSETKDHYDQRYYRRWMHELPPMHHRERLMEVDLHHALLPLTSRIRPNSGLLWEASRPLADAPEVAPCTEDLWLHSAAQLFHDGEIAGALGGMLDLHQLSQEFGAEPGFWERLIERARMLQLERPTYYGIQFCVLLLDSPIPLRTQRAATAFAPDPLSARMMRLLVPRVLEPRAPPKGSPRLSTWLLYLRSHWLRMPPGLLTAHLLRKGLRRLPAGRRAAGH